MTNFEDEVNAVALDVEGATAHDLREIAGQVGAEMARNSRESNLLDFLLSELNT